MWATYHKSRSGPFDFDEPVTLLPDMRLRRHRLVVATATMARLKEHHSWASAWVHRLGGANEKGTALLAVQPSLPGWVAQTFLLMHLWWRYDVVN